MIKPRIRSLAEQLAEKKLSPELKQIISNKSEQKMEEGRMAKHHHQSKAEQIDNKEHDATTFHHGNIQIRAYHLYQKNGGNHLDNWLQAEKDLRKANNFLSEMKDEYFNA